MAMTYHALKTFQDTHGVKFRKITQIPLEGDGTVARKVDKYVCLFSFRIPPNLSP